MNGTIMYSVKLVWLLQILDDVSTNIGNTSVGSALESKSTATLDSWVKLRTIMQQMYVLQYKVKATRWSTYRHSQYCRFPYGQMTASGVDSGQKLASLLVM